MTRLPATKPEPSYKIKVNGNQILVKKQDDGKPPKIELTILEKIKIEGTDVVSFKFGKQDEQKKDGEKVQNIDKSVLECNAGPTFFGIGEVYNDSKGSIRHFTISSSLSENFIMLTTRIRDSPYKQRLVSLEKDTKVKVKSPQGEFVLLKII